MRFDDTLDTVLSADLNADNGRATAWRQLVDLIGRGRAPDVERAVSALAGLRDGVSVGVRAASARAIEHAAPPAALVRLLATDLPEVAAPVLRSATLEDAGWEALLPSLTPASRAVLRNRRDLSPAVRRALDSFGSTDFVLPEPDGFADVETTGEAPTIETPPERVEALVEDVAMPEPDAPVDADGQGGYRIVDVMARLDAFQRTQPDPEAPLPVAAAEGFQFETDAAGVVRWVEGVSRGPLIGLSLGLGASPGAARVDGTARGAMARRSAFRDARLAVAGTGDASGDWRLSAAPTFDAVTGRFTGYRGTARRPRRDERAGPDIGGAAGVDQLRQLVHELRTPAGAIAGFAEMIEAQLLGPVPTAYRQRAAEILEQSRGLVGVIDDLDLAARIDGDALDLREDRVALGPVFATIAEDLTSLAELRGAELEIEAADVAVAGDRRAVERLLARLLATLVSASVAGEAIHVRMGPEGDGHVAVVLDRPAALDGWPGEAVFDIDDAEEDGTLLGTGFALRLARNLAAELGGTLSVGTATLTLRLPEAQEQGMERAGTQ